MDLGLLGMRFQEEIKQVKTPEDLHRLKAAYLGKEGPISLLLRNLKEMPPEARSLFGAEANRLKQQIEETCRRFLEDLLRQTRMRKIQEESVDVTLPGRSCPKGSAHPLSQVLEAVEDIFREIGFSVFEGPEVETDYYNFEALNIPRNHPARDMQATFFLGDPYGSHGESPLLLRTHTSPVQIHVMKKMKPPIRMIAPGVVYRRDSDISHTPMFHQVEGLVVGEGIRFSDLKGLVISFLQRLFEESSLPIRFRPSYFPFTEPSAEVDIGCVICHQKKGECRLCKGRGWLEAMGCGMVHPNVFRAVGYDVKKVTGLAFGMGIERLTMLKFRIPDIRLFFENDLRFLRQF